MIADRDVGAQSHIVTRVESSRMFMTIDCGRKKRKCDCSVNPVFEKACGMNIFEYVNYIPYVISSRILKLINSRFQWTDRCFLV